MAEHPRQADTAPPTIIPDSGLEPFTFALPQWMRRIRDRNPLVRSSDRIEAGQAVVTASMWAGIVAVAAAVPRPARVVPTDQFAPLAARIRRPRRDPLALDHFASRPARPQRATHIHAPAVAGGLSCVRTRPSEDGDV